MVRIFFSTSADIHIKFKFKAGRRSEYDWVVSVNLLVVEGSCDLGVLLLARKGRKEIQVLDTGFGGRITLVAHSTFHGFGERRGCHPP